MTLNVGHLPAATLVSCRPRYFMVVVVVVKVELSTLYRGGRALVVGHYQWAERKQVVVVRLFSILKF